MILTEEDIKYINNKYDFAKLYFDGSLTIKSKNFNELEYINDGSGFFVIDDEDKRNEFSNIFRMNIITDNNLRLQLIIILNYLEFIKTNNQLHASSFVNIFLNIYFINFEITKDDFKFKYDSYNNEIVIIKTILSIKLFRGDHVLIKSRVITDDINNPDMRQIDLQNIKHGEFIEPKRTVEELNFARLKIHDPKRESNIYKTSCSIDKISPDLLSYLHYLTGSLELNVDFLDVMRRHILKVNNDLTVIL